MSDNIMEMMAALRDDPEEMRRRKDQVVAAIAREEREEPKPRRLLVDVELDANAAKSFRLVEIFLTALRGRDDVDETVKFILLSGLSRQMDMLEEVRDQIYAAIGIAEGLTAETVTDEEREVAEAPPGPAAPVVPSASDYWRAGYVTTMCPQCGHQAFWHPEKRDLDCTVEGPIGTFETMPRGGKK